MNESPSNQKNLLATFGVKLLISNLFLLTALVIAAPAQKGHPNIIKVPSSSFEFRIAGDLPKSIKEASGLQATKNLLWTHNDGGIPALYGIDSTGTLIRAIQVNGTNKGWEDIARDDSGNVYIGNIGNNKNNRKDLRIYKIPDPEHVSDIVVIPQVITFSYDDQTDFPPLRDKQNFDADALIWHNNALYLFTKDRSVPFTGMSKVYRLEHTAGEHRAELIDSLYIGDGAMIDNWITGADISPDKKTIALLLHDRIWLIRNFIGNRFSQGTIYELKLNHYSHKAGISFKSNDLLYVVDEMELGFLGGKLYYVDLTSLKFK